MRLILTTTALTLALAAPAAAHVTVDKRSPGKGATVKRPTLASVTFSGPIVSGTLRVSGPGGRRASVDAGARDPRHVDRVLVELRSGLENGTYTASWSIQASDGHRQKGTFTFRVRR